MKETTTYQKANRVATITLNRPEKRNALNPEMVSELDEFISAASADPDVKIIVLRAAGEVFCAGADLEVLKDLRVASYEENLEDSRRLSNMFFRIHNSPKVVIAAVHGHAIAGGCGLISVCDIAIAREGAKFGYTETRIGFVPAIVALFLIRKTGMTTAKRLLLSGELIDSREAERIGLITESAEPGEFDNRVNYWVQMLLEKTSGEAMMVTKKLIHFLSDHPGDEAIRYAIETNAASRGSEDCKRGIDAFLNREKITW